MNLVNPQICYNQWFDLSAFFQVLYYDVSSKTMKFHGKMHSSQPVVMTKNEYKEKIWEKL